MSEEVHFLQVAKCDDPTRIADVVFIHGLGGDARATWTYTPPPGLRQKLRFWKRPPASPDGFWPQWLSETFPNIGIWSLAYPAAATAWTGHAMALPTRAQNVLERFRLSGLGQKPLILVTHSLGGLLAKNMLHIAHTHSREDWHNIATQVRGILFLATPHAGALLASLTNIFQVVARTNPPIDDLRLHSPYLEDLNNWFCGNFDRLALNGHVLRESHPINGVMVVDRQSANPGINAVKVIEIDANHITICKPVNRDSLIYQSAVDFVRKCLDSTPPSNPSKPAPEKPALAPPVHTPSPKPIHLPYPTLGTSFQGRQKFLDQLHTSLQKAPPGHATAIVGKAIHGLGGVGKTRLAVEYAWTHAYDYSALLFIPAETPEALERNLAGLCAILGLEERHATDESVRLQATLHWLAHNPGWLLILDNLDTREAAIAAENILKQLHGGRVLLTGRHSVWSYQVEAKELDVLPPDDARRFLLQRAAKRRRTEDELEHAHWVADQLGGLALALEQAAAYIDKHRLTFAQYRDEWTCNHEKVLHDFDEHLMKYPASVATTWRITVDRLSAPARNLLHRLAWLSPEPIPESLLQTPIPDVNPSTQPDALAELAACSLVTRASASPTFTIHRLVQDVTRQNLKTDDKNSLTQALQWLNDAFTGDPNDVRTWPTLEPLAPHVETIAAFADAVHIPHPTASLMNRLATLLYTKALHSKAEPLMRRALAIDETSFGKDHPEVATALNNLAQLLKDTNRLAEAESLMRRALAIDEISFGKDHPNVATDLNNLALLLQATNRLADAEPLMRRALAIDEASFGKDHPKVAIRLNNLAQLLQATNRLADAEPLMRRVLAIDEASFGKDHPEVATDLNNLAALLMVTNRFSEAEPLMRRVISIFEKSFGEDHPNVAMALNNLAQLLQDTNRLAEAEPLMRRALAIDETSFDKNHPNVARDLNNLALLLQATNRLADAEPLSRRHLTIFLYFTRQTGHPHPHLKTAINNYASLLLAMGKTEEQILADLRTLAPELFPP
jgi:tetratricopeptide (TPR) repeat protein/predicted alpha/beta hydrolase family esterase